MSLSRSGSFFRRALRGLLWAVGLLLAMAALLAFAAWRKSSTPLVPLSTVADARVDLAAFQGRDYFFPSSTLQPVDPARFGWDVEALKRAHSYTRSLDTSSLIVLPRGVPIALWGDVARRENSQSIRKSLLSSLFGGPVAAGLLDLGTTLDDLGIDDDPPLTAQEKTATIRDLLLSRSGLYPSAIYETGRWKRNKPERSSAAPGEEWYYNNWGFNALCTVFETFSGSSIADAFAEQIAAPIGMEDYRPRDVIYLQRNHVTERIQGNQSNHPAYVFMISARDLARFGLLYLAEGRWGEHQVLPAAWVRESTLEHSQTTGWDDRRYGYMWWVHPPREAFGYESVVASGGRGHKMTIVPALDLVVVHRIPTGGTGLGAQLFRRFVWHAAVDDREHDRILEILLEAYPDPLPETSTLTPSTGDRAGSQSIPSAGDGAETLPAPDPSSS